MDRGTGHWWPRLDTEKTTLGATERDEPQRDAFRTQIIARSAADFVIVDETGSNVNVTPRYARAPRGQRAWPYPAPYCIQLDADRGDDN